MSSQADATLRVVAVDDDEQHLKFVEDAVSQNNVIVSTTQDPHEGLDLIRRQRPHLAIIDLMMPGVSGMELLEQIVAFDPGIEVVLLTGHYSTDSAVEAIQKGASDYLTKPVSIEKLQNRVESLLSEIRTRRRCLQLENELVENYQFEGMVGRSPLMLEVFHKIQRVAPHYRTMLVTGPTGTGKELVARALHHRSPVAGGPLITCNCSALVETLAESELFGHVKGAFTGASQDRVGVFEAANGGTVLLDEVGELSLPSQAKLLRVLQNQEIQRVGSPAVRRVDARVVAATNRDLQLMVREQRFREDLFYRLSMVQMKLPSLAERKEDMPLLEQYFLGRFAAQYGKPIRGLTPRVQAVFVRHTWPGNVRELENVLGNACMMMEGSTVDVADLPEYLRTAQQIDARQEEGFHTLEQMEKIHTLRVLEGVNGNKVRAAELLGISRAKLYRILSEGNASDHDSNSADGLH